VERSSLPVTVKDLVEECLKALDLRDSTRKDWRRIADVEILPRLGARPLAELSRGEVRRWSAAILERSRHTANTAFKVLRRAYSWGIAQDLVQASPFLGLPRPAPEVRNSRWLRPHELRALWQALRRVAAGSFYPDVVRLLLLTALRRGEVLGARREEFEGIAGKEPRWIVPASRMKGAREHVVPLSRQAAAIVRARLKAVKGSCLFPTLEADRPAPWISRFSELLQAKMAELVQKELENPAAKVERWTIHSLRHTVATHMQDTLQVQDGVVALVLAHRPPGLTDVDGIYLRGRRLEERRQALQRWADWLARTARARKVPAERMRSGREVGDERLGRQVAS
jgi:integrase